MRKNTNFSDSFQNAINKLWLNFKTNKINEEYIKNRFILEF